MYEERIKEIRQKTNLSVAKMAYQIGIPARTITGYERGERTPSIEFLTQLSTILNVNPQWFLFGIGEIFINNCENTHAVIKNNNPILNFQDWGNRLNKILAENELTLREFSKKTGIKEHRLEDFVLNSAEPTMSEINLIKSNIDISIDELFYGETVENKQAKKSTPIELSADEIIKIKKLLEISNL